MIPLLPVCIADVDFAHMHFSLIPLAGGLPDGCRRSRSFLWLLAATPSGLAQAMTFYRLLDASLPLRSTPLHFNFLSRTLKHHSLSTTFT